MASSPRPVAAGVRVRVPAKINLALKVGAPRADGYHPLATVYQAVSLYDEVYADWAKPDQFEVAVFGEGADRVPLDDSNLAVRAARLLAQRHAPQESLGVTLSIKKSIPVAGGLAAVRPMAPRPCWPALFCGIWTSARQDSWHWRPT